jgi:GT2 family glycosyltransferase
VIQPTILIPAYRRRDATRRALLSLRSAGAARLLLVDDEGSAGGPELAAEFPGLEVLTTTRPVFWTGAIVLGIERCLSRGDPHVLFFNQDVTAAPDYLQRLSETATRHPGALIGSVVLYAHDPSLVWSGGVRMEWFGRGMRVLHHGAPISRLPREPYEADWLFGMGTLVPAEVFERIGLPDAETFPMSWGDTDFTLRARAAGFPILVDPRARLSHEVGSYDARASGPPSARRYVSWMLDRRHNLSLSAHAKIWRRHGPRYLWPLSLALRIVYLIANYARIRLLFPGERRAD